jgi:F-type H+-transporting ATPase subunit a
MPKHTTFLTYILYRLSSKPGSPAGLDSTTLGDGIVSTYLFKNPEHPTYHTLEPILTSVVYMAILIVAGLAIRAKLKDLKTSVVPSERFTLATVFEVFFGYFYDLSKEVMGAKKAKQHFPLIGASAGFITFSNVMGLIPGFGSPTSSLNVTLGCAAVVFVIFNYYGFKVQGWGYLAHMAGPMWFLAPLIFPVELFSTCVRVLTLSIRLMVNIAVDHMLAATFLGLVALLVPIPLALLGLLVCLVQGLVFCLLTAVYIALATEEHEGHGEGHGDAAHAH